MGLFDRKISKAAISPAPAKAAAAGGFSPGYSSSNVGVNMIGQYYTYREGEARNQAVSVPTINRANSLFKSVIGSMPLRMYNEVWDANEESMTKVYLEPRSWLRRPDPTVSYQFLMSWTLDDLFFYGRAFWYITSRTADGYPASFTRLPAGSVTTTDQSGPVWFAPSSQVYFQGGEIDPANLVQFLSPEQGLIYSAPGAIETALKLEGARNRNASSSIPAGVLKQTGGEPLSAQELADLASAFNAARATNQTAALNEYLSYTETNSTPDKMLLIEASQYQALEMSRLANVPPYLVGVATGAYSYQSSQQARADLYLFGVKLYADAIAGALSMDNVLPRGTSVCFDAHEYLEDNFMADSMDREEVNIQENTQEEIAS
jgi:phage portal protein BeeE